MKKVLTLCSALVIPILYASDAPHSTEKSRRPSISKNSAEATLLSIWMTRAHVSVSTSLKI